jgi:hypothetical protein
VDAVQAHPSIIAAVRLRGQISGSPLVGEGFYWQEGKQEGIRIRLELMVRAGAQASRMLQVHDGRYLHLETQLGEERHVQRIDLVQLRSAGGNSFVHPSQPVHLTLGGLPGLLASLTETFQFGPADETMLEGMRVFSLIGRLRSDAATGLSAQDGQNTNAAVEIDSLPEHVPHEVLVLLGRENLFPYVVAYRRGMRGRGGEGSRWGWHYKPLLRIELLDVRLGARIDPRRFRYQPGDAEVEDLTQRYFRRNPAPDAEPR